MHIRLLIPKELQVFLTGSCSAGAVDANCSPHQTVKDIADAAGIPHVEIGGYLINGRAVDDSTRPCDGDTVTLEASRRCPAGRPTFILDVHLGTLARYMRILGFDVLFDTDMDDCRIAETASREGRIVLTRDRGLLKRKILVCGYWLRSQDPRQQLREVSRRYSLGKWVSPLTRCARCNGLLAAVSKEQVLEMIPPKTRGFCSEFRQCSTCGQLYWKGTHYPRIAEIIELCVSESM